MKTWMKILMWFGLGGGIGFFAGYQVGCRAQKEEDMEEEEDEEEQPPTNTVVMNVNNALGSYRGDGDVDGDKFLVNPFETATDEEDAEMPEEPVSIGDENEIENDIPQLHPQHLVPREITENEYYENSWGYDQESLIFYGDDNVLFDNDTRRVIKNPDDVIGLGRILGLDVSHETMFVVNDTLGTLFRIDYVDAAYKDELLGGGAPEYVEEDEEDFTEDDIE